jgi:AraC family transcriptional regulator of adaptative response/methylated-DNA-[protein]-cysteine methyltransferase
LAGEALTSSSNSEIRAQKSVAGQCTSRNDLVMNKLPPIQEMQRAYLRSDPSYDGIFFLAVRTTGVFCRPSCRVRKPLPKNVSYYASVREALFAGFRPCKRCRPLAIEGRPPDWVERLLTEIDRSPKTRLWDRDLRARRVDPTRARRYFLKYYGVTFQAYCRARRMGQALEQI